MQFVNLHRHDTYSLFDGLGTPKQAAEYAKELGQPALSLTNHGNVAGLVYHYDACKVAGVKPILGVEAYFQPRFDPKKRRFHMTILCMDNTGYRNLMRMLSYANQHQFYRYPIIDWPLFRKYQEGLIVLSGCMAGYIPALIQANGIAAAEPAARMFANLMGNRFYLEVQPIDIGSQSAINLGIHALSVKTNIPIVMTADSHFVRSEDYSSYEIMYRIADRKPVGDYSQRFMLSAGSVDRYWHEMHPTINPVPFIEQTLAIADRCNVELKFGELIPQVEWDMPSDRKLKRVVREFLHKYCKDKADTKEYFNRAERELSLILAKGFQDYFLLCYDLISTAQSRGIATGFGRGSVCGSLVAFALGITKVDPILFRTSFERFLHEEKTAMPDIDMDFGHERRGELVDYILRKFEGKSAPIITSMFYRAKNLWNDLAKLFEVDREDTERVKDILEMLATGEQAGAYADIDYSAIEQYPELVDIDQRYDGIMHHFCRLYGQVVTLGQHPAGIAISAKRIDNYLTVTRLKGKHLTSYDMDSLAKLGVVKIDVLGLSTASILRELEDITGEQFDATKLISDPKLYAKFRAGETEGIFQFERGGSKKIIDRVEPSSFNELVACNAMNRPGTLANLDPYVEGKAGNPNKSTPWYKFTKDTYGTLMYQEQVMAICHAAGMSLGDADKVMKSVNAKATNQELLAKFVKGAETNLGLTRAEARRLYRQSTLYLFNKSHATGYTLVALYQMYFKVYYPLEFWYATLKYEKDDTKQRIYQGCAVRSGVVLFPAHINGTARYSIEEIEGEKIIRAGLASIPGIGVKAATAIEAGRPYDDDTQILAKLPRRVLNKRAYEILTGAGACEFDQERIIRSVLRWNQFMYQQDGQVH